LSATDLDELLEKGEPIEAVCRFCGEKYSFTPEEVRAEIDKKKAK
ncbi:MAG: Hsp33 family molecular chaperone HslO, partial [Clostridia bacterium]|nr:Hsp33 family molecular chaperone HslO [Clostridia bacterium]